MRASRRSKPMLPAFKDDERGVLQVLESIMASMILLGAILFVTISSSSVRDTGSSSINLTTIAEDTLTVLTSQPGLIDANVSRLDEIVDAAIMGDTDSAELFLSNIMPVGTRYALRLDNGIESTHLLPISSGASMPRAASGASTYIMPNWIANSGSNSTVTYMPGAELNFSTWATLTAPDGNATGPGGEDWIDIWRSEVPTQDRIPPSALYGIWDCTGGTCIDFRIALEPSVTPPRALYAVELLLWEGV
jgi:hypothetical protein